MKDNKKKKNPLLIAIQVLLLVVLAAALVYIVYSSMQANDELNKPAPTPTPTAAPTPTPTPEPTPTPVGLPDFEPHALTSSSTLFTQPKAAAASPRTEASGFHPDRRSDSLSSTVQVSNLHLQFA